MDCVLPQPFSLVFDSGRSVLLNANWWYVWYAVIDNEHEHLLFENAHTHRRTHSLQSDNTNQMSNFRRNLTYINILCCCNEDG